MKLQLFFLMIISLCQIEATDFIIDSSKTSLLSIPTPDGTLQAVHPDIIRLNKDNFYITYTPYPYASLEAENICGYFSKDGNSFFETKGMKNPIVEFLYTPDGKNMLNNDPDVYYDDFDKKYYIAFQRTYRDHSDQFVDFLASDDCINWKPYFILNQKEILKDNFSLSPALLKKNKDVYMFFVNFSQSEIRYLKKEKITEFVYSEQNKITINLPGTYKPWHVDLFKGDDSKYYMLISAFANGNIHELDLFLAESDNLINWSVSPDALITHSKDFYNSKKIYRSTGLLENGILRVWFSIQTFNNEWRIGYTEFVKKEKLR